MFNLTLLRSNWVNYLPITYTFQSRIITPFERVSWVVIFPLFLFLVAALFCQNSVQFERSDSLLKLVFDFSLHFVAVVSVYEVGYLYNDFVTTKKERNPTLRQGHYHAEYASHFFLHVSWRITLGVAFSAHYWWHYQSWHLALTLAAILGVFYIHNTVRNRMNILTYLALVSLRYVGILVGVMLASEPLVHEAFFSVKFEHIMPRILELGILVFLAFPLCRTMEHACKKKYGLQSWRRAIGNFDRFRVKYYAVLLTLVLTYTYWQYIDSQKLSWSQSTPIFLFIPMYFLVFRVAAYWAKDRVKRNKHQAY